MNFLCKYINIFSVWLNNNLFTANIITKTWTCTYIWDKNIFKIHTSCSQNRKKNIKKSETYSSSSKNLYALIVHKYIDFPFLVIKRINSFHIRVFRISECPWRVKKFNFCVIFCSCTKFIRMQLLSQHCIFSFSVIKSNKNWYSNWTNRKYFFLIYFQGFCEYFLNGKLDQNNLCYDSPKYFFKTSDWPRI